MTLLLLDPTLSGQVSRLKAEPYVPVFMPSQAVQTIMALHTNLLLKRPSAVQSSLSSTVRQRHATAASLSSARAAPLCHARLAIRQNLHHSACTTCMMHLLLHDACDRTVLRQGRQFQFPGQHCACGNFLWMHLTQWPLTGLEPRCLPHTIVAALLLRLTGQQRSCTTPLSRTTWRVCMTRLQRVLTSTLCLGRRTAHQRATHPSWWHATGACCQRWHR
jgi:hypothetical protein